MTASPDGIASKDAEAPIGFGTTSIHGAWWARPLCIHQTAKSLGISITDLAAAAGLGREELLALTYRDIWPVRGSRTLISDRLRALCAERGASQDQLARLFEPLQQHTPGRSGRQADASTKDTHGEAVPMLIAKQSLRAQARKAFKLFVNPFDGEVTNEDEMFSSNEIAYVREACMQAAMGARFVAIVGESGSGKTTMLADLEARIQRDKKPVQFIRPWVLGMEDTDRVGKTLKAADILASIITTLEPLASIPQSLQARSTKAKEVLLQSVESGVFNLVVIEEAHCLPDATLRHLKRLHEMRRGLRPLLGILLIGQPELAQRLDPRRAGLREVIQRCEVVHLQPLDDADLKAYLAHRVKAIDRQLGDFIDASGLEAIRARLTVSLPGPSGKSRSISLVYPLVVNNLMTGALNTCAEIGAPVVTADVVRAV